MGALGRRKISNEEADRLGLPKAEQTNRRKISNEEAAALGVTAPPPTKEPGMGAGEAAALGFTQGGTLGFGDELYGAIAGKMDTDAAMSDAADRVDKAKAAGTYDPSASAPEIPSITSVQLKRPGQPTLTKLGVGRSPSDPESAVDPAADYRRNRDYMRGQMAQAADEHPIAYNAANVAGAVAVPLPGPGKLAGLARLLAYGGIGVGVGGLSAAGHSTAELTGDAPELGRFGKDVGVGAAIGAPLAVAGGAVGDFAAGKAAAAKAGADAAAQRLADKTFASARGAYGGEVSSASRTLEVMENAVGNTDLPSKMRLDAAAFLASPEGAALRQQVVRSAIGQAPDKLARVGGARDAMADAAKVLDPAAIAKDSAGRLSWGNAADAVGGRLKRLAFGRLTPMLLGAGVGGAAHGGSGAIGGAIAGSLLSSLSNPAVTSKVAGLAEPIIRGGTQAAINAGGEGAANMSTPESATARYLELLKDGQP